MNRAEAEAVLDGCDAAIEESGAAAFAPFVAEERARLAQALSADGEVDRWLRESHRMYTEVTATGHAARIAAELEAR